MTISSLLTLFAVILAIIAFISENDRRFALLKFSGFDWFILAFFFVFINYLIAYNWFRGHLGLLARFEYEGYPIASTYAYLISVGTLIWLTWKIYKGPFPESNKDKLISYYRQLLFKSEYSLLATLIEKYQLNDIIKYLDKVKTIQVENLTGLEPYDREAEERAYNNAINTSQLKIAAGVYGHIINSDAFIEEVANNNPYFFVGIIEKLDTQRVANKDLIDLFVSTLMRTKNKNFFRELRNTYNLTEFDSYVIDKNTQPILFSLLNNINVAKINHVWRSIGELAILEIQEDTKQEFSLLRESTRGNDEEIMWEYRMFNAIVYFDIMIRQAITVNLDDSLYMAYYWFFTQYIIENTVSLDLYDESNSIPSKNHKFLQEIVTRQLDWLTCVRKTGNVSLLQSICKNIGLCVYEIATTPLLTDKTKEYLIGWIWSDFVLLHIEEDAQQAIVDSALNYWIQYFKTPIESLSVSDKRHEYVRVIRYVYDNRDIPKFDGMVASNRVQRFLQEVLTPLENPPA
ncbi:hypothetical protein [uncultured Draconibacterium sp.]|uniref:hypothetical protein n=1 Tax=uncultured Draconibacterium sp. TaxID=1573823 RepID=UPI002AA6A40B|nr:hypothetical protein [uncultured Draconibacterium sp.]